MNQATSVIKVKLDGNHSNYHCGSAAAWQSLSSFIWESGCILVDGNDYDILVVNGEGTMHHNSAGFMKKMQLLESALARGKRAHLVNTVWQSNGHNFDDVLPKLSSIAVREILSQTELRDEHGIDSHVFLDSSYFCDLDDQAEYVDLQGAIAVTDFYSAEMHEFVRITSRWADRLVYLDMRQQSWSSLIRTLRTASLLITGRHHAVYAACRANTPFLAVSSNTHKIEGLLATAGCRIPVLDSIGGLKDQLGRMDSYREAFAEMFQWMSSQRPWSLSCPEP